MLTQEDVTRIREVIAEQLLAFMVRQKDDSQRTQRILQYVEKHRDSRGHARCWENDRELYLACGLEPGIPTLPTVEEHRAECDKYRAEMYGVPVEQEPLAILARMREIVQGLTDRVAGQSELLANRAEKSGG